MSHPESGENSCISLLPHSTCVLLQNSLPILPSSLPPSLPHLTPLLHSQEGKSVSQAHVSFLQPHTLPPSHLNLHLTPIHSLSTNTHPPSSHTPPTITPSPSHPHITRKQISPRKARQASSISWKKKHGVDPVTTPSDSRLNV